MTVTSIDDIVDAMKELERQVVEDKEKTLAEIITKYDFIVGSKESHERLKEI